MHRKDVPLRRIAFALAVPVIAVGAVALYAGVANSSTATAQVAATDAPNGPQQLNPNESVQPAPGLSDKARFPSGIFTGPLRTFRTVNPSGSASTSTSGSASRSPSVSPSKSTTRSPTAKPSGSVVPVPAPGGGGGTGPVVLNCANAPVSPPSTVQVGTAADKQALVDQSGCALYLDNKDTATTSACDATCQQTWAQLPAPGQAGTGLDQAKIGSFTRADGTAQVTYNGHQLYHFAGDTAPGQANGQGTDQTWYLVDPSGNAITS